jgi:hypothetical protein
MAAGLAFPHCHDLVGHDSVPPNVAADDLPKWAISFFIKCAGPTPPCRRLAHCENTFWFQQQLTWMLAQVEGRKTVTCARMKSNQPSAARSSEAVISGLWIDWLRTAALFLRVAASGWPTFS